MFLTRLATWIAALLIGAVFGMAGTVGHALRWGWFPVGMLVAGVSCAAMLIGIRLLTADRWLALAAGAGMLGAVILVSGPGPGGSVIVENTPAGQFWTLLIGALVLIVVAWPDLSRRPRADGVQPEVGERP